MAKIEIATLGNVKTQHANVSNVVGIGVINERNDVMLIQALFKLIGYTNIYAKRYFGLSANDIPELTGIFDVKTILAIWGFQRIMSSRLLSADGKIHPASYKDRVLKNALYKGSRLMAITLLNIEAVETAIQQELGDVPVAVKKIAPTIMFT